MSSTKTAADHTLQGSAFMPWVHPEKRFSIDIPESWQSHKQRGDHQYITLYFSPPEDPGVRLRMGVIPHNFPTNPIADNCPAWQHLLKSLANHKIHPCHQLNYRACTFLDYDGNPCYACCTAGLFGYISVQCPPSQQHIYRPLFNQMLASLRLADSHSGRLAVLRSEVLGEFLRDYPDADCRIIDEQLHVGCRQVFVENLLNSIESAPQRRHQLIQQFVLTTHKVGREARDLDVEHWDNVRQRVYPLLRPADLINAALQAQPASSNSPDIACRQQQLTAVPWLANLVICYAIDSPQSLRFVVNSDLERWNIDQPSLHRRALLNLKKVKGPEIMGFPAPDGSLIIAIPRSSSMPAKSSWLLHPRLYQNVRAWFSGPVWAIVPNRDTCVLFAARNQNRAGLQKLVHHQYSVSQDPVSDCLFQINPDGIVLA
jgi:hypothetical protein